MLVHWRVLISHCSKGVLMSVCKSHFSEGLAGPRPLPQRQRRAASAQLAREIFSAEIVQCVLSWQVPTYLHTYIHTYIHTDIQTYRHTDIQTYRHTDIQTYRHTYRHTDIQTYRHTDIQTYRHTYVHTYIRTYVHTYIRTYIHTYIHAYIHTYRISAEDCGASLSLLPLWDATLRTLSESGPSFWAPVLSPCIHGVCSALLSHWGYRQQAGTWRIIGTRNPTTLASSRIMLSSVFFLCFLYIRWVHDVSEVFSQHRQLPRTTLGFSAGRNGVLLLFKWPCGRNERSFVWPRSDHAVHRSLVRKPGKTAFQAGHKRMGTLEGRCFSRRLSKPRIG